MQAIAKAGAHIDFGALGRFEDALVTDVAKGTYAADASALQAEFAGLFKGSSVSTTLISQTYGDLLKIVQSSKITSTQVAAITGDLAAIKADLAGQGGPAPGGNVPPPPPAGLLGHIVGLP